jgi:hypothetical protein
MRELLADDAAFRVPRVAHELSAERVLATEFVHGVPLDKCAALTQETRNAVATRMLSLTIRELFEFHLVQTDPNWSNFLYDADSDVLSLIDFGAVQVRVCVCVCVLVRVRVCARVFSPTRPTLAADMHARTPPSVFIESHRLTRARTTSPATYTSI